MYIIRCYTDLTIINLLREGHRHTIINIEDMISAVDDRLLYCASWLRFPHVTHFCKVPCFSSVDAHGDGRGKMMSISSHRSRGQAGGE